MYRDGNDNLPMVHMHNGNESSVLELTVTEMIKGNLISILYRANYCATELRQLDSVMRRYYHKISVDSFIQWRTVFIYLLLESP